MRYTLWVSVLLASLSLFFCTGCPPVDEPPVDGTLAAMEVEAFNLVNQQRVNNGLAALTMNEAVRTVARNHSQDMVDRNFFSHTNPDGDSPFDRLAHAGITYSWAGENIAMNQGYSNPAETAVTGWMESTGHRENILRPQFTQTGMGIAESTDGAYYFTQVFINPEKGGDVDIVETSLAPPIAIYHRR